MLIIHIWYGNEIVYDARKSHFQLNQSFKSCVSIVRRVVVVFKYKLWTLKRDMSVQSLQGISFYFIPVPGSSLLAVKIWKSYWHCSLNSPTLSPAKLVCYQLNHRCCCLWLQVGKKGGRQHALSMCALGSLCVSSIRGGFLLWKYICSTLHITGYYFHDVELHRV